jgi:uncharacterized protein (DUF488 family)
MMTIGHSNRPLDELIGMLQAHGVDLLVDVRTVPKSLDKCALETCK